MTFEITPGTIYSSLFPFSDLSATKKRPVLALGGVDRDREEKPNAYGGNFHGRAGEFCVRRRSRKIAAGGMLRLSCCVETPPRASPCPHHDVVATGL